MVVFSVYACLDVFLLFESLHDPSDSVKNVDWQDEEDSSSYDLIRYFFDK